MAAAATPGRSRCVTCGKDNKATLRCGGCLQEFCYNHLIEHRQELSKQLDEIGVTRDHFRQTLTQQMAEPEKHALLQQINDWERDSIEKIQRTAEEARQTLFQHTTGHMKQIEVELDKFTEQLRQNQNDNDFFETDLHQWNEELKRLSKELSQPSSVSLRRDTTPLINKISVVIRTTMPSIPNIPIEAKWTQNGITVAGGNGQGQGLHQFNSPNCLFVDDDQTIYVCDYSNSRIVEWKKDATSGRIVAGSNGEGSRIDQLSGPKYMIVDKESDSLIICDYNNRRVMRWPRQNGTTGEPIISNIHCYGLAIDSDGYLYTSNVSKHEVRRWKIGEMNGTVVAGGSGAGNSLNQLNHPTHIFVDQDNSVYVSDRDNNRVMKWMKDAKQGIIIAGGQGQGNGPTQFNRPRGIVVDRLGTIYVADYRNHRIMRWVKEFKQGSAIIGINGSGKGANQLSGPWSLSFDRQNNLYIVDQDNHRVQKFNIESNSNI